MNPVVSIIVPVYRTEAYIKDCMKSIAGQTFKDFEVIIVDNNTDDKAIEFAQEVLKANDINFKIVTEVEQGQNHAKNKGIEVATGEWLVFVDSDDMISPFYLERLLKTAEVTGTDVAFCKFKFGNDAGEMVEETEFNCIAYDNTALSQDFLIRKTILILPAMIIRRSLFSKYPEIKNNKNMRQGEDLWQIWMILSRIKKIGLCNSELYLYRRREFSTTTKVDLERVITCHEGFMQLKELCAPEFSSDFMDLVVARQDFGLIRASAQYGTYSEFNDIKNTIFPSCKTVIRRFPDYRVKILLVIISISSRLFYVINHR